MGGEVVEKEKLCTPGKEEVAEVCGRRQQTLSGLPFNKRKARNSPEKMAKSQVKS